eukprot:TRINITY_DN13072_c0_g1_i4.p3 TRINITY_DN13072_c0_g1~~TRINITY_DN13072_c0_g1_i4.p3  ORF type:complete len:106 (+),score=2.97 TRINITY_DN13072_c0_g1_i4:170-487(+)
MPESNRRPPACEAGVITDYTNQTCKEHLRCGLVCPLNLYAFTPKVWPLLTYQFEYFKGGILCNKTKITKIYTNHKQRTSLTLSLDHQQQLNTKLTFQQSNTCKKN